MRIVALIIWAGILAFGQPVPSLPHYDWGACPGEYCGYKEWTLDRPVTVYDTWKDGRKAVAQLAEGSKVTGLTGVVIIFQPGQIRMDRDLPEKDLRKGDVLLTYGYSSEGFSAVWFKGKYYGEFDVSFTKWPDGSGCGNGHCAATSTDLGKKAWWAEVKLASGLKGWVEMDIKGPEGL
jgi:hypothetical protein